MKFQLANLKESISDFKKLYYRYRIESDRLRKVRYQIKSTLEEYRQTSKIILGFTDCPGDLLPPMTIKQIKDSTDIISNMHPVDVNSINDLHYLNNDKVIEIRIMGDEIIAITQSGLVIEYDVNTQIDIDNVISTRVSYIIGHLQAEKLIRKMYKEEERYTVVRDNISTLYILDNLTKESHLKNPIDILFSEEYKQYSKADIARIGYICGQMSGIR
ncbi:hypothetical protein [Legionella erythra]|uniref:Uncharacterized protein n=1 Tax=Legionella erythra TaxID=448 RepID=A0A0W0TUW9_LEGER|nr:hypothetical protein [Legionella erythra]KTC99391.1 hypothetical protein Lery_0292 [Legionella erythra]